MTDKWIKKFGYIYTMECYSAIKRNTFESIMMRWINLKPTMGHRGHRSEGVRVGPGGHRSEGVRAGPDLRQGLGKVNGKASGPQPALPPP